MGDSLSEMRRGFDRWTIWDSLATMKMYKGRRLWQNICFFGDINQLEMVEEMT
jgi:hypothetical protein